MQTPSRKTDRIRKEPKEESTKKQDEKLKRSVYTISAPRDFVQKSTTADIYAQKKKSTVPNTKTPKKVPGTTNVLCNVSPMKGLLKSSPSSVSQISQKSTQSKYSKTEMTPKTKEIKASIYSARKSETPRKQPSLTNVTVNSPAVKRKLNLNLEHDNVEGFREYNKEVSNVKNEKIKDRKKIKESERSKDILQSEIKGKNVPKNSAKDVPIAEKSERQRTKTRTLDENEVKVLTVDVVDNNAGMINLKQKLVGKPKAFYVDLEEDKPKPKKDKSSDEEVSYEDDFESYESDFDSYHSDQTEADDTSVMSDKSEKSEASKRSEQNGTASAEETSLKEGKDEEKMLDSGNFELRDQRSAKTKPSVMDFISEDGEDRKTVSLTDEGFQDMSSASASSSLKTQDVLDRPLFIDFTKAKHNKLKRKVHERLKQRAKDLLGMITLHEMSYSLFEMQPISYDLYMATFGRSNNTQSGVQTFDDGITEEVQTDEIVASQKWTQHPVEFSKHDVYVNKDITTRKCSQHTEDYLSRFTFLMKQNDGKTDSKNATDDNYKNNPLRIYLEQKDGAGGDEMLPYETYKSKLKTNDYNTSKLGKFLKKFESTVSHVLSSNTSHKEDSNLSKSNKIPFSKGFVSLSAKTINNEKLSFLKYSKISNIIFSETKGNLILTVHKNAQLVDARKSLICLWDFSVASIEPMKVLSAIDDIVIGRFRGNIDGVFAAALEDGSMHLWDLSEEPTWQDDAASEKKPSELIEFDTDKMTEFERVREWNLKNSQVGLDQCRVAIALQSCAFTNSAANMTTKDEVDRIVGLEMNAVTGNSDAGRRVIGQIISLQRIGILTIWFIIQEKLKSSQDMGKAFLSKMKLEKSQTIHLTDHIDFTSKQSLSSANVPFNLNAAKRRLSLRKKEKNIAKNQVSRPSSAMLTKLDFDIDRPSSAASLRKRVLPVEIIVPKNWETGIVCNDLKIMRIENVETYLVAKNCGEVLCCRRCLGAVRIERFTITSDTSSVTNLQVSTKGLPYFLAATSTGTINVCSILDHRVLLTLDCSERAYEEWSLTTFLVTLKSGQSCVKFQMTRNVPSSQATDKCVSDHKGRFISSVSSRSLSGSIEKPFAKLEIKSVQWSPVNPCAVHALLHDNTIVLFELTHSDIYAKFVCENAALQCTANDYNLALLTPEGEVQIHRLCSETQIKENLVIFEKYIALL